MESNKNDDQRYSTHLRSTTIIHATELGGREVCRCRFVASSSSATPSAASRSKCDTPVSYFKTSNKTVRAMLLIIIGEEHPALGTRPTVRTCYRRKYFVFSMCATAFGQPTAVVV
ncbi:hypothetical protein EVAR_68541_1 [Eumeta japonica]|uniref:Uncharacterized protein n=1 Tax=Eumeta variegata TaxID=151549 RepID=A0A4C1ZTY4_EUMVA|nr:hypothetical protein EVAR_68541_1 [Eumeta japonica]